MFKNDGNAKLDAKIWDKRFFAIFINVLCKPTSDLLRLTKHSQGTNQPDILHITTQECETEFEINFYLVWM